MNTHVRTLTADEPSVFENPPGLLEYEARCAVRNLIRLHGYETARDLIAGYLNDEAERKPRQ
jgi:hypothetical protein